MNYRTASLCRAAVASARSASSEPLEVIVVDNSCDAAEAEALGGAGADTLIVAPANLGYAGGVNAGLHAASGAKIVVSNPDVVFGERCIDELVGGLEGNVALTGPRFSWDAAGEWLLPPADMLTFGSKLSRTMAKWSAGHASRRRRARFHERVAFWRATAPIRVAAVSGAVMAIERSALERAGGLDERYRLYYEEIDLMRSLARQHLGVLYVPSARCHHLFDQSAASALEHQRKFTESEARYMAKWHGAPAKLLELLDLKSDLPQPRSRTLSPSDGFAIPAPPEEYVVEASPLESFDTAAGHFPAAAEVRLPAEIWDGFRGAGLFVRVVEASGGREISRGLLLKSK